MTRAESRRLELLRQRLDTLAAKRVLTDPMAVIQDKRMLLGYVQKNLYGAQAAQLARPKAKLAALAAALDAMSPLKVLGRGFAMVTDGEGNVVRGIGDAPVGSRVTVALSDGKLECLVEKTE